MSLLEALPSYFYREKIRAEYVDGVNLIKELYKNKVCVINDAPEFDQTEDIANTLDTYYVDVISKIAEFNYTKNMQSLTKVTPHLENEVYILKLSRSFNIITALYVPEDCNNICLYINDMKMAEYKSDYKQAEPDIEVILQESKVIPPSKDDIEYILWLSKKGRTGYIHSQEEKITINGQIYKRVILLQPAIPLCSMYWCDNYIIVPDSRDIYVESIYICELVKMLNENWICFSPYMNELVIVTSGTVTNTSEILKMMNKYNI